MPRRPFSRLKSAPQVPAPLGMGDEIAAFRRMLQISAGTFSLSFAVCDDRSARDAIIGRFTEEFPGILRLGPPEDPGDLWRAARDRYGDPPPPAIFIVDLEGAIPHGGDSQPVLRAINSGRELWERFHCPVVFWLASYALVELQSSAPDLYRYRSHLFTFVPDSRPLEISALEPFPGYEMVDALPPERKALRILELERRLKDAGDDPPADLLPHALVWTYELAWLHRHANRYAEAEAALRKALARCEQVYGVDHERTAEALGNLAQLLKATNRLAEAEPLMRRALAIDEASFGKENPEVASDLNNLATLLQATNRLPEAEPLMRRALAIVEASFGQEHPNVAIHLSNLAMLLQATNRLSEAEPLMLRALAIVEASFGKEHPEVATALNNLASLLQDTNRLSEAEPLMRRVVDIFSASLGEYHPNVATALNNLASLLQDTNRLAEAELLMRRALEIFVLFTLKTGHPHPHLETATNNYGGLLTEMGDTPKQARAKIDRILAPLKKR